jgi:ribonuclease BN (tRNA processing enzyme)
MNKSLRIITLGTNGWFATSTGRTTCVLIDAPEAYVILDAGTAIQDIDLYINDEDKPIYLFLSHFHMDHICGIHILNKFSFKQGLNIVGQIGLMDICNTFF